MKAITNADGQLRVVLSERDEAVLYEALEICGSLHGFTKNNIDEWDVNDFRDANLRDVMKRAGSSQDELCELILEIAGLSQETKADPPGVGDSQPE